jgi:hypothetical protein
LWTTLTTHPKICIGLERYLRLYQRPEFLDRSLFEPERFWNIEPGDTVYSEFVHGSRHDAMRARYADAEYWGDKIPMLFLKLPELDAAFGQDLRVVMIVRDVYAVAESWQRRLEDPNDKNWPDFDYRKAVKVWNDSIDAALQTLDSPLASRFLLVSCERLFGRQQGLDELFEFLSLGVSPEIRAEQEKASARFAQRPNSLFVDDQRDYIAKHANLAGYAELVERTEANTA